MILKIFTLLLLVTSTLSHVQSTDDRSDIVERGHQVLEEFYHRYSNYEVDLVFVLDRSASVMTEGWGAMLAFVRSVLQHFTVDNDNTRVAIVTYSTVPSVDINDLGETLEDKCSLMRRIRQKLTRHQLSGFTATHDALVTTRNILYSSRRRAKKAVFVLTDGRSNIGLPPVRASVELRSLQWNSTWNVSVGGPQLEIYAFGIQNAVSSELASIASPLQNHTYHLPNFRAFEQLARSLHRDQQIENWHLLSDRSLCHMGCSEHAHCACGTRSGDYHCVCKAGYHGNGLKCEACSIGFYKQGLIPGRCHPCPAHSETRSLGAYSLQQCLCKSPYYREDQGMPCQLQQCEELPSIPHGRKFQVQGRVHDERPDSGVSCDNLPDNSCHYQCSHGYRLTGHPGLICLPNGTWQGQVPSCQVIDCQSLDFHQQEVTHGVTTYTNNSTIYGSTLAVTCDRGWRAFGDTLRTCNHHGTWSGTRTWCVESKCPPLPPISQGQITPESCSQGRQMPGQVCSYMCNHGYQIHGPAAQTCDLFGHWTLALNTSCVDVEPPVIICPDDIRVPITEGNFTFVHWQDKMPKVMDNSGEVTTKPTVWKESPAKMASGYHQIEFMAEDKTGNQAFCTLGILVVERTVQNTFCPGNITRVDVAGYKTQVTWQPPVFLDNNNDSVEFYCNPQSGTLFSMAAHSVFCEPLMQGQTASCQFYISLTRRQCDYPRPPRHGSLICPQTSDYLMQCIVQCNDQYDFFDFPQEVYNCQLNGQWSLSDGQFWPDCSEKHFPGLAVMQSEYEYYYYSGDCEDVKQQVVERFLTKIRSVTQQMCGKVQCDTGEVTVNCGAVSRKRRATVFDTANERDTSRFKRELTHAGSDNSSSPADDGRHELTVHFAVNASAETYNNTLRGQRMILLTLRRIEMVVQRYFGSENFTVTDPANNKSTDMFLSENYHPIYGRKFEDCGRGFVTKVLNIHFVSCVACPVGMFHDENEDTCKSCPQRMYQDKEGSVDCKSCPGDTMTLTSGADNVTKCLERCPVGHYSSTGLEPCSLCGVGSYQEVRGQMSCKACPVNTTNMPGHTETIGSCKERCSAGTYNSSSGLHPCLPCPVGTFQSDTGSLSCILCPSNMTTLTPGTTDVDVCQAFDFCEDITQDSCNNGDCVSLVDGYLCDCHRGYTGDTCDIEINECDAGPCLYNSTCQDLVDGFLCLCQPTYTGERCETRVSLCDSSPCENGGSCEDTDQGYHCYCPFSYTGSLCQSYLPCATRPCDHGNCETVGPNFRCRCHPGFIGELCDQPDHCVSRPCRNGGTCTSRPTDHVCSCILEYTGLVCETPSNETCVGVVCLNGGVCRVVDRQPLCRCVPGYGGQQCEQVISPNFDLVFDPLGSPGSVLFRPGPGDLKSVTACMWIRTQDTMNYGTPFSYAVETNELAWKEGNMFTLTDYGQLKLYIHGDVAVTTVRVNDGRWQHLCVAWQSSGGLWWMYVNGTIAHRGDNLAQGDTIPGEGYLVLGQKQHTAGDSFSSSEAFIGELSQFNVFDRVLDNEDIMRLANQNICNKTYGNVVAWTEVVGNHHGNVRIRRGSHCLDVNECLSPLSNNCILHRHCTDLIGGFECKNCSYGYQGDHCDESINECHLGVCQNEAACMDGPLPFDFHCDCRHGYTGASCEVVINVCDSSPCQANSTCVSGSDGGHTCLCPPGVTHCDAAFRTCYLGYCQNNAICNLTQSNQPQCVCPLGFQGQFCEVKVIGCRGDPCQNDGTCTTTSNGYKCHCRNSWKGDNCEIAFSPNCDMYPCLNNGTCVVSPDQELGYTCECGSSPGLTRGPNCEHNPCEMNPCQNSGTCILLADNSYSCLCPVNITGQRCEGDPIKLKTPKGTQFSLEITTNTQTKTTTLKYAGDEKSCSTVVCDNGGTCIARQGQDHCICTLDYTGRDCTRYRQRVTKEYQATILVKKPYHTFYKHGWLFKHNFTKEVSMLYSGMVNAEDRVQAYNIYIRPGRRQHKMMVTYTLLYTKFLDSEGPTLTMVNLRQVLEDSLLSGFLGSLPVSHKKFSFKALSDEETSKKKGSDPGKDTVTYLVAGIIFLLLSLIILAVFVVVRLRRVAYSRTSKLMQRVRLNNTNNLSLQLLSNPVFDDLADRQPSDNMYAELSDSAIDPYCVSTKSEIQRGSSTYSSKRSNKECNLEKEAARKTSELSDTAGDCAKKLGTHYDSVFSDGDSYISPLHNKNQIEYTNLREKNENKKLLPLSGKLEKRCDVVPSDSEHDMESGGFEPTSGSFDSKEDNEPKVNNSVDTETKKDNLQSSIADTGNVRPSIPSYANTATEKITEKDSKSHMYAYSYADLPVERANNYFPSTTCVQKVNTGTSPDPVQVKSSTDMAFNFTSGDIHTYNNSLEAKVQTQPLEVTYDIPQSQHTETSVANRDKLPTPKKVSRSNKDNEKNPAKKKGNTSIMRTESASQTDYVDMTNGLVLDKVIRWRRKRSGETAAKKLDDEDYNYVEPNIPDPKHKQSGSKIIRQDSASQTDYLDMTGGKLLSQFSCRTSKITESNRESFRRKSMHDYLEVLPGEYKDEDGGQTSTLHRPVKTSGLSESVSTSTLPRATKKPVLSGSASISSLSKIGRKDMSKRQLPPLPRHAEV
ncbi:sushi, von Willebrand factor type A, EGF and pentraxin domain-containing protein 1-like [Mizuhopecten yessoensis]|uniref:sushi, von Willebrand factor type A, EGF and pentraxin domain-containing protein 1-like n=1 Tax=Mizuhopecten yessoensis TaxID=6573 RepID=UPI000B45D672|nr:sushi, von Willebrand factor type A, EGF and pentraxin domain-containing protein 1-like [Mizuhopecten yessoensis]